MTTPSPIHPDDRRLLSVDPAGLSLEVVLTPGSAGAALPGADPDGGIERPDGSRSDGGWAGVGNVEVGSGPGSTMAGGPGSGGPGGGDGLLVAPASSASSSNPEAVNAR
jgi:hypothetical protein